MSKLVDGKSFCFTGKSTIPRAQLSDMVERNGGTTKSSIVVGLDYLVMIDPDSKTVKTQKAHEHGVKIISETEFLEMVGA